MEWQRARAARSARRGRRGRAVCKLRGVPVATERPPVRANVLTWRQGSESHESASLVHVLTRLRGVTRAQDVRVRVVAGSECQWNRVTVRRAWGGTLVRVRLGGGRQRLVRLAELPGRLFTTQTPHHARVVRMYIVKVREREQWRAGVRGELVRSLATTQHGGKDLLKIMGFRDLEIMWSLVAKLKLDTERERARGRLAARARAGWGVSLLAKPVVRLPMSALFPRAAMQSAVRVVYEVLGASVRPQVHRLAQRTRYVCAQPVRVGDKLCNWRNWCKNEYVPGVEPKCTCKGLAIRGKGAKLEGHLALRGSQYKGPGWRALHCSAKTVLSSEFGVDELRELVRDGLVGLVRSMPARIRDEAEELGAVERAMERVTPTLGQYNARGRHYVDEPTMADVQVLRATFGGQVISEIDKARGELAIL